MPDDIQIIDEYKTTQAMRMRIVIRGAVQGVGFRPYIYRLATEIGLRGWVVNSSQGVFIEAEGNKEQLEDFLIRIEKEKPECSYIRSLEHAFLDVVAHLLGLDLA